MTHGGADGLPGRGPRRRQDLRDARRGAPAAGARHRRRGRPRRDPRPATTIQHLDGLEVVPRRRSATAAPSSPRWTPTRSRPAARGRAGRRARAHQRAGQPRTRSAATTSPTSCRGHRRDHHREHPAPRVAQRRGRADHGRQAARDRPRRGGPRGRPDPARRHVPAGAAAADGARQHLPRRAGRRLAVAVLPGRQPHRAARAGPAVAGRPGRRRAGRLPRGAPDRARPGRPASGSSSR